MKIIVGLGNPGPRYISTRHNLGFMVLDSLAASLRVAFAREKHSGVLAPAAWGTEKLLLVKPMTYMNRSGDCVAAVARNKIFSPDDLLIVVDDIHLPLGKLRFRAGGSAGGHNGIKSIIERFGTPDFHRLRLGVGGVNDRSVLVEHVLSRFHPDERADVDTMVERATQAVLCWVETGIAPAMNQFNG